MRPFIFRFLVSAGLVLACGMACGQNAATDWSAVAERTVTSNRSPASSEVLLGIVHAAMFDAAVAVEGHHKPITASTSPDVAASPSVAVATAAYQTLKALVPAQQTALTDAYSTWLAGVPEGEPKTHGIRVGEIVATQYVAWRKGDGFNDEAVYKQQPPSPGMWELTAPPPASAVDFKLAQVRPLVLESTSQFRPSGPPSLTSDGYRRDLIEVKRLGAKASTVRTAGQTETAQFWSEHTGIQWSRTLRNLAIERGLSLLETTRMLALAHVAAADAMIACFDAKYHYLRWRPVHAIQRSELSGEAGADKDWQPLLNVNHPEYPSAHGCWTGAVVTAVKSYFGSDDVAFTMESTVTKTSRRYNRLSDALDEVVEARIASGLHYRQSMIDGAHLGEQVARYVAQRKFSS